MPATTVRNLSHSYPPTSLKMAFITSFAPALRHATLSSTSFAPRAARVAVPRVAPARLSPRMDFEISEGVTYKLNPAIVLLSAAGWIIPSSLPAGIPLTGGAGLSQAFFTSISANLDNFPAGPASADPFWTLCFMWHIGLFTCTMLGSIGFGMQKAD